MNSAYMVLLAVKEELDDISTYLASEPLGQVHNQLNILNYFLKAEDPAFVDGEDYIET